MCRYHHADAMKAAGSPVRSACKAAAVSASSYYDWKARGPSAAELAEGEPLGEIRFPGHASGACVVAEARGPLRGAGEAALRGIGAPVAPNDPKLI